MSSICGLRNFAGIALALAMAVPAWSVSKPHVVFLGKPLPVKIFVARDEGHSATINVRPLYVDTKLKDYTTGDAHDVTDRQFVVQRAYRLNDSLPGDSPKRSKWVWQRGDWLLVDRVSGHIAPVKLPDFDAANSRGKLVPRLRGVLRRLGDGSPIERVGRAGWRAQSAVSQRNRKTGNF